MGIDYSGGTLKFEEKEKTSQFKRERHTFAKKSFFLLYH